MIKRFDSEYWNNPMYFLEAVTSSEVHEMILSLKADRTPFSLYFNGSTFSFNKKEHLDLFISGLETYLSMGLPFDAIF